MANARRVGRSFKRVAGKIGAKIEEKRQIRAEKKRIFKEAFIREERKALVRKARYEARQKVFGRPRRKRAGFFPLPSGVKRERFTLFPEPIKKRRRK